MEEGTNTKRLETYHHYPNLKTQERQIQHKGIQTNAFVE
jgi:hypothetical protein